MVVVGYSEQRDLNVSLLTNIYVGVSAIINDPVANMEASTEYYAKAFEYWAELVKLSSPNPSYALQNLDENNKEKFTSIKHKLRLLQNTYGTKSES